MHIDDYSFGRIAINGKEYREDVLIYPDGAIKPNWQRSAGHKLAIDDLPDILVANPNVFIMGTGYDGVLKVLPETEQFLKKNNIELYQEKTGKAIKIFNEMFNEKNQRVMAGFHITC